MTRWTATSDVDYDEAVGNGDLWRVDDEPTRAELDADVSATWCAWCQCHAPMADDIIVQDMRDTPEAHLPGCPYRLAVLADEAARRG